MIYDPASIASYFDEYALAEWHRLTRTPASEISLHLHEHYLRRHIAPGSRVLEIGAGPGRFTERLAKLDCRIVVVDISAVQIDLNQKLAEDRGFAGAVERWVLADICDLSMFGDGEFDAVVTYGGPLSYALDRREQALAECIRVARSGAPLLLSVMSLWGGIHADLRYVMEHPWELSKRIIATGELYRETQPLGTHYCHLFRSHELRSMLERRSLDIEVMSASGVLAVVHPELDDVRASQERWSALLEMELEACVQPGCLDMGTHLIAVARTP